MDLNFDRATNTLTTLTTGAGKVRTMEEKRGDKITLNLRVRDGDEPGTLAAEREIRFGLKETFAGAVLALASEWSVAAGVYSAVLDLNTEELLAAIASKDKLTCVAELTISEDGGESWVSSQTISFTVRNDVLKEDDGAPTTVPGPDAYVGDRAVCYDREQTLTVEQKAQAAGNLGFAVYNDRAAANAGLAAIGIPFFNLDLERYDITTDVE